MSQHEVVLLLGSNLGDTEKNIRTAIEYLRKDVGKIVAESEVLFTKPVEFASKNIFCNIALLIKTQFSPVNLLISLKEIEHKMGRKADSALIGSYTDKIIDIDIVSYEKIRYSSSKLNIPHSKHLFEREFSAKLLENLTKNLTI